MGTTAECIRASSHGPPIYVDVVWGNPKGSQGLKWPRQESGSNVTEQPLTGMRSKCPLHIFNTFLPFKYEKAWAIKDQVAVQTSFVC